MEERKLLEEGNINQNNRPADEPIILEEEDYSESESSGEDKYATGAAPATSDESNDTITPKGGGDTMAEEKKTRSGVWKVIGTVIGVIIIALLLALLLKGCDNSKNLIPSVSNSDEVADLRAQLAAEKARADAEKARADAAEKRAADEAARVDLLLAEPRIGDVTFQQQQQMQQQQDIDWTQWVHIDIYNAVLGENAELHSWIDNHECGSDGCDGSCGIAQLKAQLAVKDRRIAELEAKIANHVCTSTPCNGNCSYCVTLRQELEDTKADLAYALDGWAKDQARVAELEEQLRNHRCPSCDGTCAYCVQLRKELAAAKADVKTVTKTEYRDRNWYYIVYVHDDTSYEEEQTQPEYLPDDFWDFALDSNPYANGNGSYGTGGNSSGSSDEPYGTGGHSGNDPFTPGGGGN